MEVFTGLVCIAVYGLTLYIVADLLPIVKDDLSPIYKISLAWTYAAMALAFATIVIDQLARIAGILSGAEIAPATQAPSAHY
jgi:TRAP-type C4-dicarboxylate transport system permease small subunit